jgi:hypothetical protein
VSIVTEGMYTAMRRNGELRDDNDGRKKLFERS